MGKTKSTTKKPRKRSRIVMIPLAILVLGVVIYDLIAVAAERHEERNTPRIGNTKFAVGSEVLDISPTSSEQTKGAVLLVHGFVGGSSNFGGLPDILVAEGWKVRGMRLPGHGTTPRDFAAQTPESLLNGVRSELAALKAKYDQVHIVGHSMGGALTTHAAALDGATSIVLAAPAFGVSHQWYYGMRPEKWTKTLRPVVPWVYKGDLFKQVNRKEAKPDIYSYTWVPSRGLICLQNVSARARNPEVLAAVKCPVLLIHGRGDVAANYHEAAAAFSLLGTDDKKLVTLEKSNHHIFWDFESDLVCREIADFLAD